MAHKRDRDEHYNAKVQMQVQKNLKAWEEARTIEERQMVSIKKLHYFSAQKFQNLCPSYAHGESSNLTNAPVLCLPACR